MKIIVKRKENEISFEISKSFVIRYKDKENNILLVLFLLFKNGH